MRTQRANHGQGATLDAPEVVIRLTRLRLHNGTLKEMNRIKDKKRLDDLEAALPKHITDEADRVIATLTQEIRDVGKSVAALHWDLMPVKALARGEVVLDDSMSLEQQKAANDVVVAISTARKRQIAADMKAERATAKAAAKAVAKPQAKAREHA